MAIRIRQLLPLVKLGKNICYAYRARSVEAIRLCEKLEQDLDSDSDSDSDSVARYGTKDDGVHNHNPSRTVQDVDVNVNFDVWQQGNAHERFGSVISARILILFSFLLL